MIQFFFCPVAACLRIRFRVTERIFSRVYYRWKHVVRTKKVTQAVRRVTTAAVTDVLSTFLASSVIVY